MLHINDLSEFKLPDALPLAPNGKVSKLSKELYDKVRTVEFIRWFGDWEKDPANASKILDENGEPLVVYHGTPSFGFNEFLNTYDLPRASANETNNIGTWFSSSKEVATEFMFKESKGGIYEVFLNIRNPRMFKPAILNTFEIERIQDKMSELSRDKRELGWYLSDMSQDKQKKYHELEDKIKELRSIKRNLKLVDSFEQFMSYRDKYTAYIDGIKGQPGYWYEHMMNTNKNEANKKLVQEFRAEMHDGIVIENTEYDMPKGKRSNQYVVFDPECVKSVKSKSFNKESKNIYESRHIKGLDQFDI